MSLRSSRSTDTLAAISADETTPRRAGAARAATLNAPELAAEALRGAILRGELTPGEHVLQVEWAEQLGVSRAVLREAFKILTGQRLLRHNPQSGYFVTKLKATEMEDLYRLRMFVEEQILRSIRWPTGDEITELEGHFTQYHERFLAGDVDGALSARREYSFGLFSLSRQEFMVHEAMRLWEMAAPYRLVVLTTMRIRDPDLEEVRAIEHDQLAALRTQDRELLVDSMKRDRVATVQRFADQPVMVSLLTRG